MYLIVFNVDLGVKERFKDRTSMIMNPAATFSAFAIFPYSYV